MLWLLAMQSLLFDAQLKYCYLPGIHRQGSLARATDKISNCPCARDTELSVPYKLP